jgi:hypothetical protein
MIDDLKVDAKKLHKIDKIVKDTNMKEVSFEFLIGSCFPKALQNIKEEMRRQYTLGYTEGLKENEKQK